MTGGGGGEKGLQLIRKGTSEISKSKFGFVSILSPPNSVCFGKKRVNNLLKIPGLKQAWKNSLLTDSNSLNRTPFPSTFQQQI